MLKTKVKILIKEADIVDFPLDRVRKPEPYRRVFKDYIINDKDGNVYYIAGNMLKQKLKVIDFNGEPVLLSMTDIESIEKPDA